MPKPRAIPKKIPGNSRPKKPEKSYGFDGVPTGLSEYQDGICKLGEIILRHDIHAKQYYDSTPFKPCKGCAKSKPKNWLASQLSRIEYRKLAEMHKRLYEELLDFNKEVAKTGDVMYPLKFSPCFKSEYQAAYGRHKPERWISGRAELD